MITGKLTEIVPPDTLDPAILPGAPTYTADGSTLQLTGAQFSEKDGGTTNAKLADMTAATFKMRALGAGTGVPIDGTATQAKTALAIANTDVSGLGTAAIANKVAAGAAGVLDATDTTTTNARTPTAHSHAESDVTSLTTDLAAKAPLASPTFTGIVTAPVYAASGLTGAVSPTRYVGGVAASTPPTTGTFAVGDFVIDANGRVYTCSVAGSPGTWVTPSSIADVFDRPIAGSWISNLGVATTMGLPGATSVTGCWLFVMRDTPVDRIGFEVTTIGASGDLATMSLYKKRPGLATMDQVLTETATSSLFTTGFKEIAISKTLTPGRYAAFIRPTVITGAPQVRARGAGVQWPGFYAADTTELSSDTRGGIGPAQVGNPTSFPSTFTLVPGTRTTGALIYLRAA